MAWLQDEFGAVQDAIGSGAFDPQGLNYTSFSPAANIGTTPLLSSPSYSIGVKTSSFFNPSTGGNASYWNDVASGLQLPSYAGGDYISGANAANTPQSMWPTDPGNEANVLQGNKFNNALNTPGNAIDTLTGKPLGTSNVDWGKIGDFFNRGSLILIGLVFIAGALFLLAKENNLVPKMPRRIPVPA